MLEAGTWMFSIQLVVGIAMVAVVDKMYLGVRLI